MVGEIEGLEMVKDVNVEFRYQRVLLGGSFLDGKKRPGKIFTSMSFEEGADCSTMAATSNTTINWNRHLLGQVRRLFKLFTIVIITLLLHSMCFCLLGLLHYGVLVLKNLLEYLFC